MFKITRKALNAVFPYQKPININLLKPVPQVAKDGSNQKLKLSDYFIKKDQHDSHDYDIAYGAPTIYNHEKSSHNPKGIIKAMRKTPAGIYYSPAESSTYGLTFSEVIPKSFLVPNDIAKDLYDSLPHNIENKKRDVIDFKHAPVLKSTSDLEEENPSITSDITKLYLGEQRVKDCKTLLETEASYEKISESTKLPVAIIKYIANSIPAEKLKLKNHATYKEDEVAITELFNAHNVKHL